MIVRQYGLEKREVEWSISSQSVWYTYKFGNTAKLTDNLITDIKFADDNNLWMATDYGVCHYNGTWNTLDSINKVIDYAQLRDIEIDANKNIWFPTLLNGHKGGSPIMTRTNGIYMIIVQIQDLHQTEQ
jgi:hypothetical protein